MTVLEEISRARINNGIIIVQRKVYCNANIWGHEGVMEEELEKERDENNGRTLWELRTLLRENMVFTEIKSNLASRFKCMQVVFQLISDHCPGIKTVTLSKLYANIDDTLEFYEGDSEMNDYLNLLKRIREKIVAFYLTQPLRMLELSDTLSEELLTVEVCLLPQFIPYLTRKMETPNWMVPRTVRTLNDASRIYQTREFVKKEGMELFMMLMQKKQLPSVLCKMIAHYAVDLSKLRFVWFDVVTELMLKHGYNDIVYSRQLDFSTRMPTVIITV